MECFSSRLGLKRNPSKRSEWMLSRLLSFFPTSSVTFNSKRLSGISSVKYLNLNPDINLRNTSPVHYYAGKLRALSLQIKILKQFRIPKRCLQVHSSLRSCFIVSFTCTFLRPFGTGFQSTLLRIGSYGRCFTPASRYSFIGTY